MKIEIHEGLADAAAGHIADVDIDRMVARSKGMFKESVRSSISCAEMDEAIADTVVEDFDSSTDNYGGWLLSQRGTSLKEVDLDECTDVRLKRPNI
jgi:hypothetical protein